MFDTLRNVLGQAALGRLTEKSQMGRLNIQNETLKNQLLVQDLEQLAPLRIQKIQKELEFMLSPAEEQAAKLTEAERLSKLRMAEEGYGMSLRAGLAEQEAMLKGVLNAQEAAQRSQLERERFGYESQLLKQRAASIPTAGTTSRANTLASQWGNMIRSGKFTDEAGTEVGTEDFQKIQDHYFDTGGQLPEGVKFQKTYKPETEYGGRVATQKQYEENKTLAMSWLDSNTNFKTIPDRYRVGNWFDNDEESTLNNIVAAINKGEDVSDVPADILSYANQMASYVGNVKTGGSKPPMSRGVSGSWEAPKALKPDIESAINKLSTKGYSRQQAIDYLKSKGIAIE